MPKTNDIATKKFVKEELEKVKGWVEIKLKNNTEYIIDEVNDKTEETFAKYKDETMTKLDQIVGLLEKDDQERAIMSHQVSEHTNQLENHGRRIEKLEKTSPAAPAP